MSGITSVLLARYLAGECDSYERDEVRRWIENDPARGEMLAELESIWQQGKTRRPSLDVDAFWEGVAARMDRPVPQRPTRVPPSVPVLQLPSAGRKSWPRRLVAAAVAAAAAVIVMVVSPSVRTAIEAGGAPGRAPAVREVATKRGERARVTLTDGTSVILGPESRLRFASDFGVSGREVDLRGQAYFSVVHDERRPFRVRTPSSVTEDLGTEFVVREYPAESTVWVAVASGRVALAAARDERTGASAPRPVVLTPGAVGRVDSVGRASVEQGRSAETYLTWTAGELRFQRAPLGVVADELRRWYDLDVRLGDASLAARTVTARFKDQSADAVLQSLATVLELSVRRSGRSVTLLPR